MWLSRYCLRDNISVARLFGTINVHFGLHDRVSEYLDVQPIDAPNSSSIHPHEESFVHDVVERDGSSGRRKAGQ